MKLLTQIGQFVAEQDSVTLAAAKSDAATKINAAINLLRDSAPDHANTLAKLYELLLRNRTLHTCKNNAERFLLAPNQVGIGDQVFVKDDGDGRWCFYIITETYPSIQFEKTLDPDNLASAMTAAQIRQLYESNPDTNQFNNAEKAYLSALFSNLIDLTTDNKDSYTDAINELHVAIKANRTVLLDHEDRLRRVESLTTELGSVDDFLLGYNSVIDTGTPTPDPEPTGG